MASVKQGRREVRIPGFYTCEQAAAKLRVEADTIRRYINRGLIRAAGIMGNSHIIAESDLQVFQKSRRKPGRPKVADRS